MKVNNEIFTPPNPKINTQKYDKGYIIRSIIGILIISVVHLNVHFEFALPFEKVDCTNDTISNTINILVNENMWA